MFPIFIDLVVTFSSDAEVPKIMNSVLLSFMHMDTFHMCSVMYMNTLQPHTDVNMDTFESIQNDTAKVRVSRYFLNNSDLLWTIMMFHVVTEWVH